MTMDRTHTIEDLEIGFRMGEANDDQLEANALALKVRHHLLPRLDRVLSDYSADEIRIDALDVELGNWPINADWIDIADKFETEVRLQILAHRGSVSPPLEPDQPVAPVRSKDLRAANEPSTKDRIEEDAETVWRRDLLETKNATFLARDFLLVEYLKEVLESLRSAPRLLKQDWVERLWEYCLQLAKQGSAPSRSPRSLLEGTIAATVKDEQGIPKLVATLLNSLKDQRPTGRTALNAVVVTSLKQLAAEYNLDEDDTSEADSLYTDAAGLVLLAPYMPILFERCKYVEDGTFSSERAQFQAAALLQHVVTGHLEVELAHAPLEFLLCGLNSATKSQETCSISATERETVSAMLEAVTAQWKSIGQTSVEGLRTSFLFREGILRSAEENVALRVSPAAYDMLLDQLPWSYSPIAYSWMPCPLFVEWRGQK